MTTTWHATNGISLECNVIEELPLTGMLAIDVTDARAKGTLKKFAGKRTVRAYQVYNYKPQNPAIKVGYDGRQLPDPKTLKGLGDQPDKPADAGGQDVTVTKIEE